MLASLVVQHFRKFPQKKLDFHPNLTVIVGQNTAGKTNLMEAIYLLSTGKSFRAEKDLQMIAFGQDVGRVQGLLCHPERVRHFEKGSPRMGEGSRSKNNLQENEILRFTQNDNTKLEVTLAYGEVTGGRFIKRFFVDGVGKSRNHFVGPLPTVLFRPEELDIIIAGPSLRREFLDAVLEQVDPQYRAAKLLYDKAIRQRNALLDVVRETGIRNVEQFGYWDELLITNGAIITQGREALLSYINDAPKDIFDCIVHYDKSLISAERLLQYKDAEVGSATTLVGPHRDDFFVTMKDEFNNDQNIKHFGSRGQERLVVLQLKLLQIAFMKEKLERFPLLLLDDIFSELDSRHIDLVLKKIAGQQVIMTTTHKEFLGSQLLDNFSVIELNQ